MMNSLVVMLRDYIVAVAEPVVVVMVVVAVAVVTVVDHNNYSQ